MPFIVRHDRAPPRSDGAAELDHSPGPAAVREREPQARAEMGQHEGTGLGAVLMAIMAQRVMAVSEASGVPRA
jgi:hypothetical protein